MTAAEITNAMPLLYLLAVITGTFTLAALLAWLAPNAGTRILPEPKPLLSDDTLAAQEAHQRRGGVR